MQSSESFRLSSFSAFTRLTMDPISDSMSSQAFSINTTRTTMNTSQELLSSLRSQLLNSHWTRRFIFEIVMHSYFNAFVLVIIMLNTVILAMQISIFINANYGWYMGLADSFFLGIYIIEAVLKIIALHAKYFTSGWNLFDFIIVLLSIATSLLPILVRASNNFNPDIIRLFRIFRAFRAIRSLRALRAVKFFSSLQVIVETLLQSIPAISSILSLALLVLYIFAVIGRTLYGSIDYEHFGNLFRCIISLFTFITLDNWSDVFYSNRTIAPDIYLFLFIFILLETFVFLNLFVAVICSNLDTVRLKMTKLQKRDQRGERPESTTPTSLPSASIPLIYHSSTSSTEMLASTPLSAFMQTAIQSFVNEEGISNYYPTDRSHAELHLYSLYFMYLATLEHEQWMYFRKLKMFDEFFTSFHSSPTSTTPTTSTTTTITTSSNHPTTATPSYPNTKKEPESNRGSMPLLPHQEDRVAFT